MAPTDESRSSQTRLWPWLMAGLAMVAFGFVVGTQLGSNQSDAAPAAAEQASPEAAPSTTAPLGEPALPDEIVPPLPPDSTLPDGSLAPPSDPVDPTLPDPGLPDLEIPSPDIEALFTLPEPPEDFTRSDGGLSLGPAGIQQRLELTAPDGRSITIEASFTPTADLPPGATVAVRDTEGVWDENGALVWIEGAVLRFEVAGSENVTQDDLLDVAQRLEVA